MHDLINKRLLAKLQKIVQENIEESTLTNDFILFQQEFQIGSLTSRKYKTNFDDRIKLRAWTKKYLNGFDLERDSLEGDRLDSARKFINEKVSPQPVFGERICMAVQEGEVCLKSGEANLPDGALLNVDINQVDLTSHDKVIIVENGTAIINWYKVNLPDEMKSYLAIYRGHGGDSACLKSWLQNNRDRLQIIAFVDLDPAGLQIAMTLDCDILLMPEDIDGLKSFSLSERYSRQYKQAEFVEKNASGKLLELLGKIKSNQLSISQEAIISQRHRLTSLPIKTV